MRKRTTLLGGLVSIAIAVTAPTVAWATSSNHIYGTAYNTWNHENYVRSITTCPSVEIQVAMNTIPAGGMYFKIGSTSSAWTSAVYVNDANIHNIANEPCGTKFVFWTKTYNVYSGGYDGYAEY